MKINNIIKKYINEFRNYNNFITKNKMRYFYKSINKYENEIIFIR